MIPTNDSTTQHMIDEFAKKIPDAKNPTFEATAKPVEARNDDFQLCATNFWKSFQGGKYRVNYETGCINGTYNTQFPTIDAMFLFFMSALKNTIQTMGTIEDKKTTDFDMYFKNLELAQKLLSEKIDKDFEKDVDGVAMLGYLHGTINNFVNQNIKKG